MQLLDPPYYYHNMVKGAKYYVRADRQKFINWKAIYVNPRPQRRGAAEIAPLLNFRNSGNPYAAPNVEFYMRHQRQPCPLCRAPIDDVIRVYE